MNLKLLLWPKSTARRLKKLPTVSTVRLLRSYVEAEKARIVSGGQQTTRLRKERQRSSDKLKKERPGQTAVVDHAH